MTEHSDPKQKTDSSQPIIYQIKIEGHLDGEWADSFGLSVTLEKDGNTLLSGSVVDQAALFGVLKKVRDLGMPLISLNRVEPNKSDMSSILLNEKEKRNE